MFRYAVLCLAAGLASARFADELYHPKWSPVYEVEGVIYHHGGVQEPFQAWYDINKFQSRIDYYGGMVKTFQKPNPKTPEDGRLIKVVPMTTESQVNQPHCLAEMKNVPEPQSALPDTTGFKHIGSENLHDFNAWKWQLEAVEGDGKVTRRHQFTLWVRYDYYNGSVISVPLKYEVRSFDTEHGTQYDHFYLDYTNYQVVDEISDDILEHPGFMPVCVIPLSPPIEIVNINPMYEFIGGQHDKHVSEQFDLFKLEHGRLYATDMEHEERMIIFRQNLRYIESHNRAGRGFTLAVNHLADRTEEELATLTGLHYNPEFKNNGLPFPYSAAEVKALSAKLPEEFDWRPYGAVTPVKHQMSCGSCWAFSAVGAVEGALFLHSGQKELVRLSEQALVDCSWGFNNSGCDGGFDTTSFSWIAKHGLPTDEAYGGYLGEDGSCHIESVKKTAFIKGWVAVPGGDENALRLAIFKHGPIAVSIFVPHTPSFLFYSHGLYYEPECNGLMPANHAVLVVGYGVLDGKKYWLIKNSWGAEWGNGGYILMSTEDNNCGVETSPSFVVL